MPTSSSSPPIRAWFASRLKTFRVARGFATARSFAAALEIDENRYTRYERAEVEPDLTLFVKICGMLHVSPNELLEADQGVTGIPGFADAPAPPLLATVTEGNNGAAVIRTLSWQLAEELADVETHGFANKLDRIAHVTRSFREIETDVFAFVTRMAADRRFTDLDTTKASRIGELVEQLMTAINLDVLRGGSRS